MPMRKPPVQSRNTRRRRLSTLKLFSAPVRLLLALLLGAGLAGPAAAPALAHDEGHGDGTNTPADYQVGPDGRRLIVVVEVSGLIDPITASYIKRQIAAAEGSHALGLVLQVDSNGSTLEDDELVALLRSVQLAHIPVGIWVGPSGARAMGGAAHLLTAAHYAAVAPGGRIGNFTAVAGLRHAHLPNVGEAHTHTGTGWHPTQSVSHYGADRAVEAGFTRSTAPSVGDFLLEMSDDGVLPPIAQDITGDDGVNRRAPADDVTVSFVSLSLLDGLFHTAASPAVAYLLLLAALSLVLLDFYTGGVGIAAGVGVVCGLLAAYGLGVLDIRPWALGLLLGAFVAFAVDIQTGVPRFWTAAGCVLALVGSLALFGRHGMSWIPLLVGLAMIGAFVISGLPALVRTRYGTATVGREWMVGATGVAVTDVEPDGSVRVHDALWRARVNRLTPLRVGDELRVSGIRGVVLEVEPLEGAAVDYRQMRKKRGDSAQQTDSKPKDSEPLESEARSGA